MSTTTHAPKQIDPSASLHAESLGLARSHGRLEGRRIIVVGADQRKIIDEEPPIGNGRAMSVLFAREGASVACIDMNREAADNTVAQITSEGGQALTVPFGRQGTCWEVAYAALFLISNESSCVNAHTLFLDAGHMPGSCAPNLHIPNGSGIALAAAMHKSAGSVTSLGKNK